jgi:hypothetical protein
MNEKPDILTSPEIEAKINQDEHLDLFGKVSEADSSAMGDVKKFFEKLPADLGKNSFEAAKKIRQYLTDNGFQYNDKFFELQDMIRNKRGNCLGLSLLIGSVLKRYGFNPQYKIILHPKDATDKKDYQLFKELDRGDSGEYFTYDNPKLPVRQASQPLCHFAPIEHPCLFLEGQIFETTTLEEQEKDPSLYLEPELIDNVDCELIRNVSFEEVLSNIYIDKAKTLANNNKIRSSNIKNLCQKALEMWPNNREGWAFFWNVAKEIGDDALQKKAQCRYEEIGGEDSRYCFNMYQMTKNPEYLDKALEKFPAHIEAFANKTLFDFNNKRINERDAKFNLAVASCCIANSSVLDLKKFYKQYRNLVVKLYGKDKYNELIEEPNIDKI